MDTILNIRNQQQSYLKTVTYEQTQNWVHWKAIICGEYVEPVSG
jgi:hypothetical protein